MIVTGMRGSDIFDIRHCHMNHLGVVTTVDYRSRKVLTANLLTGNDAANLDKPKANFFHLFECHAIARPAAVQ